MNPLKDKRIILGVTGSIACYKAVDLASKLRQAGAIVDVILTKSALQFVTPLTFQSVTGQPAHTDDDLWGNSGHVLHVGLGEKADLFVIAPATANTLAKLAHGQADNLLTITALAARCPLLLAPAMDGGMYDHPATQANVTTLRARGVTFAGPVAGHLASGLSGVGRMMEPLELRGVIRHKLAENGALTGKKIVVTAGGTQEPIDPVRYITNRSSGKQGYAIAQAALDFGAAVTLISTPTALPVPAGAKLLSVSTANDMLKAVQSATANADALVMVAAVADFRPANAAKQKIKKGDGIPTLKLAANPDILATLATQEFPRVRVGFAAESQNLLDNAASKLRRKKLDFIVANDISASDAGFAVDTNRVTLLFADGRTEALPLQEKNAVAEKVIETITKLLE